MTAAFGRQCVLLIAMGFPLVGKAVLQEVDSMGQIRAVRQASLDMELEDISKAIAETKAAIEASNAAILETKKQMARSSESPVDGQKARPQAPAQPEVPPIGAEWTYLLPPRAPRPPACAGEVPKLFVYDLPPRLTGEREVCPQVAEAIHGRQRLGASFLQNNLDCGASENFLFDAVLPAQLAKSTVRTMNPEEAELFYIPAHLVTFFFAKRKGFQDCPLCMYRDRELVDFMRSVGPYWDRYGGADHLVHQLSCQPDIIADNQFTHFPLINNLTMRVCLEWGPDSKIVAHGSIKVPYYTDMDPSESVAPSASRPVSVYFTGAEHGHAFRGGFNRTWIRGAFDQVPHAQYSFHERKEVGGRFRTMASQSEVMELGKAMHQAKFALVVGGDSPESLRFQQAIMAGAIPLIVDDALQMPFPEFIPWERFIVRLNQTAAVADPGYVARIIAGIDDATLSAMQEALLAARRQLSYTVGAGGAPETVLRAACKRLHYRSTVTGYKEAVLGERPFWEMRKVRM